MDGWMNQAYSRLSITHGHITDCKLFVCMYWTRLVLVRPAAILLKVEGMWCRTLDICSLDKVV